MKSIRYFSLLLFFLFFINEIFAQNNKKDSIGAYEVSQTFNKADKKDIHPRLFFNTNDINRIKLLIREKDPLETLGFKELSKVANRVLNDSLFSYKLDAANLRIPSIHAFASQVPALVIMYQLTGEKKYAARCYAQMERFAKYPDWGANRHFLDTGIGAFDFALTYDGLYHYLNADQRKTLRDAVMKNVLLPSETKMEENAWWHLSSINWNGICNGGVIMAALAMYEDNTSLLSNIIAKAFNGMPYYIDSFNPDGASVEGVGYWGYGLMYTTLALQAMQNVLGTTFHIDDAQGFRKTGWFPLYVSGPVATLNIGDDPIKTGRTSSFFWFAKHFNDTALARFQYQLCLKNKKMSWEDMLFYDPKMINGTSNRQHVSIENYIRGIDIMSLRNTWNNNAIFIAMHGGSNEANHGHLDAGTFYIQALGEVWAYGDLGSDNYTYPGYFSKITLPGYFDKPAAQKQAGRWDFYRLRAEGHDCLVFNPSVCPDQNPMGEAIVLKQDTGHNQSSYTLDLTHCYYRDVTFYTREIALNKTTKVITVQDHFITKKPSLVWWLMNTKATILIQPGGKSVLLKQNNKTMIVAIKSPINAKFQVLGATYLPGESFPLTKNSSNEGFKKLAIQLKNQNSNTILIEFIPNKTQ
jgi:hypothetical protein